MAKVKFGSDEWVQALHNELNTSKAYEEAAKNWEGDFYFVVDPEGVVTQPMYLYMDLWHGKCREAYVAEADHLKPVFNLRGPVATWKKVMTKKLDPMQALMTGQLKLKGNMVMIMKNVKAAQELVKACTRIDAEFPAEKQA